MKLFSIACAAFCGIMFFLDSIALFKIHEYFAGVIAVLIGFSAVYNIWFNHMVNKRFQQLQKLEKEIKEVG
ncbi:hypothetical protein [Priestia megaterium]|uniref:hypothetical protein n=1 Tax=Priestia megaterium TaxID=1404 RepID=UPI000BF72211|nr:hypothetical protein [Priestia megaterium]PFW43765.1 hypothetical protein COL17_26520 [Priestia megaterium]